MQRFSLAPLRESQSHLRQFFLGFVDQWQATKAVWRDEPARQFEGQYLRDLPATLKRTSAAADEFAEVLSRLEQQLADPEDHSG
ncbi:MAG: hypothetical protein AAF539_08255 [Planctomycetota bacterium]